MVWVLGRCRGSYLFVIYYWMIKISKKSGDFEMREDQISSGESFFLFYQSNLMPDFVPVSPDTTDNFIRLFEHFSVNLYDIRFFLYVPDIWMNTLLNLFRVNL